MSDTTNINPKQKIPNKSMAVEKKLKYVHEISNNIPSELHLQNPLIYKRNKENKLSNELKSTTKNYSTIKQTPREKYKIAVIHITIKHKKEN